jgi:hypothetical protein
MEIKIECSCGQHYKFDVEPENGQMPVAVGCPSCGVDGTDAANSIIQQTLVIPVPAPLQPPPARRPAVRIGG